MKNKREYIVGKEVFIYDVENETVTDKELKDVYIIVFLNKIQSFVEKNADPKLTITVFGSGCDKYGFAYDCAVKQGFMKVLYEAPEYSSRTKGILDCYDWILAKELINKG
jgi:hypothetical protein